ncbi:hypothetical protein DMH04_24325 [Kibdelosporangium aridum]|uniref:Uncharacterized protein n=1 Tax=Kibdelosporangium aridum TaxID=2030 RepID=A0A428Z6B9_KIBAR|nr:hypothetical protein [Kibdelosporangium aridum]RSM82753.1 hypothetical protein DMH04_24325 [Kibdelosporangium aridum]
MSARDDARDAGLLLRFALDHTVTPARNDTYSQLLDRYHADPNLRTSFEETAAGLGVRVLTADRTTGLVLIAEASSPLAVKDTSPWLRIRDAADRMVYGVALGGVAAWCYPNARAVREPGTRRVTAVDVDRLVREHAAAVEAGDIGLDEGLGPAWHQYSMRKQASETRSGQLRRYCTVWMCERVLEMLGAFGLLVPDKTVAPPRADLKVWRSTDRFRAHVAATGGPLAWQTIVQSHVSDRVLFGDDEEDG